jgi:Putative cyclase
LVCGVQENENLEETIVTLAAASGPAMAQNVNDEPLNDKWAPSEWGADDKVGAPNRTTPEMVLKAIGLVKKGKVATLGKIYAADAPAFGTRRNLFIPVTRLRQARRNWLQTSSTWRRNWADRHAVRRAGSHWHQHIQGAVLLRFLHDKGIGAAGLGPLGVEHVAEVGFVCRGVLLDAVALRGGQLPVPKENSASDPGIVTAKQVDEMVKRQGIAPIGEGDCVFFYSGHGNIWHPKEWDTYDAAEKSKRVAQFQCR